MRSKREEEEAALFREATRGVKRLVDDRHAAAPRRPAPRARFTRAGAAEVPAPGPATLAAGTTPGEELVFVRPGVQRSLVRKLRRGQYRVEAHADLHGLTAEQAQAALRSFLAQALHRHLRCLRIVCGKGLRSGARGPVLRSLTIAELSGYRRVLAVTPAPPEDGGSGALYVLLGAPERDG